MIKKIDHIAIAVPSIEEARSYYENVLGLKLDHIEEVAEQKVKTAFFDVGGVWIELLEPTTPDSTVAKWLENNKGKGGLHHIAYESDNVAAELSAAESKGVALIDKAPRKGAGNMNIGFLHPKSTGGALTEFCSPA
ncbi:MAG: methylmalonyl-CoA epimerase [Fibromonadales bacterium]|nr:methylmalonyl-CoA epimerase [Fibromonadales bacterium]